MHIEVYSTGGGFYTAELELPAGTVATVDNESLTCLTLYSNHEFYEENMLYSKPIEELEENELELYNELYEALTSHLKKLGYNLKLNYDIQTGYNYEIVRG